MKWFKRKKDNFDPSRRKFIRDAAGLAALTAVATTGVLQAVPESTVERFKRMLDAGYIENETFYLYEPITFDVDNLKMLGVCTFVVMAPMHVPLIFKCKNLSANYIVIDCNHLTNQGALFMPCASGCACYVKVINISQNNY